MLKRRGDVNLGQKSFCPEHSGELGVNDLDCDFAMVTEIFCEVDSSHTSLPKLSLDCVLVGERCREPGDCVSHWSQGLRLSAWPKPPHHSRCEQTIDQPVDRRLDRDTP